jgi:hypothetical protein
MPFSFLAAMASSTPGQRASVGSDLGPSLYQGRVAGMQPLLLDVVIMDARVQVRLSTIDARAQPVAERATRQQRNDPALRHI